jgi:hypothetical protein
MATGSKESKRAIALVASSAAQAAAPAQKLVEDGAAKARQTMEMGMEQVTKQAETFMKAAEEAAEFGRGNVEAVTKSAQLLAVGMQDMGKHVFAVTQALTDHALESAKALAAVKSLKEAADIQAAFAKASLERSMSEAAKLQEATFKLAETVYAPITARYTLAVEKMSKPLAA